MVVSNTSPLMNLAIIGRLDLLRHFYETIHVPEAVWNELVVQGRGKPGSDAIASAAWIQIHAVQNRHLVSALREKLDPGESEAIALALELNTTLLLIDESEGRRIAATYNLTKTGALGILLLARKQGQISSLRDEMNKLQNEAHFWISPPLYEKLLRAAGE
jgi:predicted nucleic acid-binding protein